MDNNQVAEKPSIWIANPHLRQLLFVLIFVFLFSGIGLALFNQIESARLQKLYGTNTPVITQHKIVPSQSEDTVIASVSKALRENNYLSFPDECFTYSFDGSGSEYYSVDIRESHNGFKCPGDPNTSSRLLTVRVSKSTGEMLTNYGSVLGEFSPIVKQKVK